MKKLDITNYKIINKKIDKNIKLLFLSDLHNRNIVDEIVDSINKINPDIIIMGGDMVNQDLNDMDNYLELCKRLNDREVYYTFGNHEEMLDITDRHKYLKNISKYNLKLLNNEKINLSKNIVLYGLESDIDCYHKFHKSGIDNKYIIKRLGMFNKNKFNILLAHNPLEFNAYKDINADIVLSGHVHGGLVILPLFGGLFSPDYTLFPKYYKGVYKDKDMQMIVSRGLGLSKRIPIRIFNKPEIIVIELIKG